MVALEPLPAATQRQRRNAALRRRRRREAMEIVNGHAVMSAAANFVPIPVLDSVVVAGVQMQMLRELSRYYRKPFDVGSARNLISSLGAGLVHYGLGQTSVAQGLAMTIASLPVVGGFLRWGTLPGLLGVYTFVLGRSCVDHFEAGGSNVLPDSIWARMPLNPMSGVSLS